MKNKKLKPIYDLLEQWEYREMALEVLIEGDLSREVTYKLKIKYNVIKSMRAELKRELKTIELEKL